MKRVYHPTVNSWYDVQDEKVADWEEQGWLQERPEEFSDAEQTPLPVDPEVEIAIIDGPDVAEVPPGNAPREDWVRYAQTQGAVEADLEAKTRNEIRDTYGPSVN